MQSHGAMSRFCVVALLVSFQPHPSHQGVPLSSDFPRQSPLLHLASLSCCFLPPRVTRCANTGTLNMTSSPQGQMFEECAQSFALRFAAMPSLPTSNLEIKYAACRTKNNQKSRASVLALGHSQTCSRTVRVRLTGCVVSDCALSSLDLVTVL